MYRVKFIDTRGSTYWLRRGRLVHRLDNATLYAHPSAARLAMARFINSFNVAGWSIEINQVKERRGNAKT
jgi:hypothetical protein